MDIDNSDNLEDLSLKLEEMEVTDIENENILKERSQRMDDKVEEREK